jgi:hypothetical protein
MGVKPKLAFDVCRVGRTYGSGYREQAVQT